MANEHPKKVDVVVIGAGFTGLAAAYDICRAGLSVYVLEKDEQVGGLATTFQTAGDKLEKFYHHFFTNDKDVIELADDIHCQDQLVYKPAKTGIYVQNRIFRLATPFDVLRFEPLSMVDRFRLGLLIPWTKINKSYKKMESITAEQWLIKRCGINVYNVIWEPLLKGKFGVLASEVSAVWFWNKIALRGGSRDNKGHEVLGYFQNSFGAFAERIAEAIISERGVIETASKANSLIVEDGCVRGVKTNRGTILAKAVIATAALPLTAELVKPFVSSDYFSSLKKIRYLDNVSLVLELSKKLSDIYWLNITDPDFPFVGIIEHTNFQEAKHYGGNHIVYLTKYLQRTEKLYSLNSKELFESSLPHIKRLFPTFDESSVRDYHVFKGSYSQPLVERHYGGMIPSRKTPIDGFYISSMAQIYPQDRGCNYAIREGRRVGKLVAMQIKNKRLKAEEK